MKKTAWYIVSGIALIVVICMIWRFKSADRIRIEDGFNVVSNFEQFELEGEARIDANPWNVTVGLIEDSGEHYVFMVPGTALILDDIEEYVPFEFTYRLYYNSTDGGEEVGAESDGAGLAVIYKDKKGDDIREDTIFIDYHADTHCYHTIPLTALSADVNSIEIHCNSGYYGDGTWDWVILQ